jgi:hypothetical protein
MSSECSKSEINSSDKQDDASICSRAITDALECHWRADMLVLCVQIFPTSIFLELYSNDGLLFPHAIWEVAIFQQRLLYPDSRRIVRAQSTAGRVRRNAQGQDCTSNS